MQGLSLYTLVLAGASALLVLGCDAPGAEAGGEPGAGGATEAVDDGTAELAPVNRSGITGTVEADREDAELEVSIELDGLDAGVVYPVNLYEGRCAAGGAVAAPLGRVTARDDGTGTLTSRVGLSGVGASDPIFVQVETAAGEAVACGDLGGGEGATPMTDRLEADTAAGTDPAAEGGA